MQVIGEKISKNKYSFFWIIALFKNKDFMERVFIYLQTERDMKEYYMMELNKEMENITISMEIFMK